jgi:hypothetical protein
MRAGHLQLAFVHLLQLQRRDFELAMLPPCLFEVSKLQSESLGVCDGSSSELRARARCHAMRSWSTVNSRLSRSTRRRAASCSGSSSLFSSPSCASLLARSLSYVRTSHDRFTFSTMLVAALLLLLQRCPAHMCTVSNGDQY